MKYRLGMLVAALTLMGSAAFAQVWAPELNTRTADGVTQVRNAWLKADQAACNSWNAWANPFAAWDREVGVNESVYGLGVGLDHNFGSNLKVGLYSNYGHYNGPSFPEFDADGNLTGVDDISGYSWDIGLYGMYRFGKFFVDAKTSYLYEHTNINGAPNGNGWHGAFNVGYQFLFGCDFSIVPTVGLDYGWLKYNKNADFSWHSLELPLLVTVDKRFATSFGYLAPFIRGGWIHEFHKGAGHGVINPDKHADYGTVGLGVAANINNRADMFAAWDYKWATRYHQNKLNLGMGINF